MINPYQQLGDDFDPFGVAVRFNLPFPLAEAFKKLTCAGIDGRVKSKEQDIKEAVYSIKRAIQYFERGLIGNLKSMSSYDVLAKYSDVFGTKYTNTKEFKWAMNILEFCQTNDISLLDNIINEYVSSTY